MVMDVSINWVQDFTAKLSDFGLAREGPANGQTHVSTDIMGTKGYVAPEYVQTGTYRSSYLAV